MISAVNPLGITVGTECNIRCRHCLVDDNLGSKRISEEEIHRLVSEIKKHSPRTLLFTGGEPTLYIKEVNAVLSEIEDAGEKEVKIITNGHFAKSLAAASEVLRSFRTLNGVIMSYDKFHAEFIPADHVHNLNMACRGAGLRFSIMSAAQSPLDLAFLNNLKLSGIPVLVQKILPVGNAKGRGLDYEYPEFDASVLEKKCPNLDGLVYNCGAGFTVCCGFMASEREKNEYTHRTIGEHLQSRFYKLLSENTFGDLMRRAGVAKEQLSPKHSAPCTICSLLVPRLLGTAESCDRL